MGRWVVQPKTNGCHVQPTVLLQSKGRPPRRCCLAQLNYLADTEDLGFERAADGVEQVGQREVVGQFRSRSAGGADAAQVGEVVFDRGCEFCVGSGHGVLVGVGGRALVGYIDDIPRGWW